MTTDPTHRRTGLHSPDHTPLEAVRRPLRRSRRRLALQALGTLVGVGLLVWVVELASAQANAESFAALRQAPAGLVAGLVALTALSVLVNGLMFWVVLLPLRRIPLIDTLAINALATVLAIAPFKISLLCRAIIHHRLHGLPFKTIVSWLAAMGALALAVLLPLGAAGLIRQRLDAQWWLIAVGGVFACSALGVVLGRLADRVPLLRSLSMGAHNVVRHAPIVAAHALLRTGDIAVLAGRFFVAAAIIHLDLAPQQVVLIATTYFLLSILTPAGTLGPREMGVAALGLAQSNEMAGQLALAALVVSAAEILTSGALAAIGALKIRPDRLLLGRSMPD